MIPSIEPATVRLDEKFSAWTGTATPEIVDLIGRMFVEQGEVRSSQLLQWQYRSHLGGAHVCIAHTEAGLFSEPAALYAAFPTRFQVNGRQTTAYQSFDTLTGAAYRGRGLFVSLARLAYSQIAKAGASLVYGIPNGESFGGFIRRLDWTDLDPLPMLIRPVGLRYLRSRLRIRSPITYTGALRSTRVVCPEEVTDLFERSQYGGKSGVIRDCDYLRWRLQRPGSSYRWIESRSSSGQLMGIAVLELRERHGGTTGYLMELMVEKSATDVGRHLLKMSLDQLKEDGADVVLAWAMEDNAMYPLLRRSGFRGLPSRITPIELHLGYRPLDGLSRITRGDLCWSYLDSDTV